MPFTQSSHDIAKEKMNKINSQLTDRFANLIQFVSENPEQAPLSRSGNIETGSEKHIEKLAKSFSSSRNPRAPTPPSTIPDNMVSNILSNYFEVEESSLEKAKKHHSLSMGAENIVGDLLERYIASVIEPQGWIWCSGSTVRAVDFIKPPTEQNPEWSILQVKNRDNSENSSSSAIRNGTTIQKWHRTFSKTGETNWESFPCSIGAPDLSEDGFNDFVAQYLSDLR